MREKLVSLGFKVPKKYQTALEKLAEKKDLAQVDLLKFWISKSCSENGISLQDEDKAKEAFQNSLNSVLKFITDPLEQDVVKQKLFQLLYGDQ